MRKFIKVTLALVLVLATVMCIASCNLQEPAETLAPEETVAAEGIWTNATYRKNTTVGEGGKEVVIDVEMDGKSISLTIRTDKATLGKALFEEGLINDASFFDTLNGVKADWDADKAYWGFFKGEEYLTVGVGDTAISGGEHYRFVYTKG